MRYVELNPVRAGLAKSPECYSWCSYRVHACGGADPVIAPHVLYTGLASTSERRLETWRNMCAPAMQAQQLDALRKSIAGGVIGDVIRSQIPQP
jgi:putative transposase